MANELEYGIGAIAGAPGMVSVGDILTRGVSLMVSPSVSAGNRLTYSGVTFPATTAAEVYFWMAVPSGFSLVSIVSDLGSFGIGTQNWVRLSATGNVYVFQRKLNVGVSERLNIAVAGAVSPSNRAPVVDHPLGNQVLVLGTPETFNLEHVFEDPDADTLSYSVVSNATHLVMASVSGHLLTLTPVAVGGPVSVVVTATDTHGLSVDLALAVDVHDHAVPNRPPVAVGTIPGQDIEVGQTGSMSVVGYFRDPDGNISHWSAVSSDASLVRVQSISGGVVTYVGVAVGSVVVTVTATDGGGQSVSQTMNVACAAGSQVVTHQPVVLVPIADQQMVEGESRDFSNISGHFTDLDGDAVSVSITKVTDRYACNAILQGNTLVLEAGNVGTSIIFVRGTDATTNRGVVMSFAVQVFEDSSAEHPVAPEGIVDFVSSRWITLPEFIIYVTELEFDEIDEIPDGTLREYGLAYFSAKSIIQDYAPNAPQEVKNQCLKRFGATLYESKATPSNEAYLPSDLFVSSGSEAVLLSYRGVKMS